MKCILFYLDTLRPDHLGCYGHPFPTSPTLDKLAADGAVFERCLAPDVPTHQAFTAFLTAWIGTRNGVVNFDQSRAILPRDITFPMDTFRRKLKHRTALIDRSTWEVTAPWILRGFGDLIRVEGRADNIATESIQWLEQHANEDFVLLCHMWDAHCPYTASAAEHQNEFSPEQYRDLIPDLGDLERNPHLQYILSAHLAEDFPDPSDRTIANAMAAYDSSIRFMDDQIGRIVKKLETLHIDEDTMILVWSDHGESWGTRGFVDHWNAYWHIAHVPLIIKYPGRVPANFRSRVLVNLTDCLPTALGLCGAEIPPSVSGQDLTPILKGKTDRLRDFAVVTTAMGVCQRMLLDDDGWALMHTIESAFWDHIPRWELHNINEDSNQEKDLAAQYPERLKQMQWQLSQWLDEQLGPNPDPLRLAAAQGSFGWACDKVIGALRDDPEICRRPFFSKVRFSESKERILIQWLLGNRVLMPRAHPPVERY